MTIASLRLTPLEILTAPLTKHIRSRRERLLLCPHGSPYINPRIDFFKACKARIKLVFIHVGKCGGESIMTYLRCALPADSFSLFEYHCFDSNKLIRELLAEIKDDPQVFIIIATRDPLERWAASFNWDYHNVVLSTPEPSLEFMRMIKSYPKVQDLAQAIAAKDTRACRFGRLEHMGMGPSWYLPLSLMETLPSDRCYCIRLKNIQKDLSAMVEDITQRMSLPNMQTPSHIPHTKANYKEAYPANTFGHLRDLSRRETESMKTYLKDDYEVHDLLESLARK